MKHANISIFIPHIGCPHRCSFCDQRTISGAHDIPSGENVREICSKALNEISSPENTEIAFFGGSFTAIPRTYMTELLSAAHDFIGEGKFSGIRISTRPDCIDREILDILKKYGVTAIELGAQSMDNTVLEANERGHSAEDIVNACGLIREYGFELGLQMMTGLYKSSLKNDLETAEKIISLKPDTVRIYPTVVLDGTRLAEYYRQGEYEIIPLDEMTCFCGKLLKRFYDEGIKVIKCGLHASEFVEKDMVSGYYHPAFRELCEMYIYRELMKELLSPECGKVTVAVNNRCISRAIGQNRANTEYFKQKGIDIKIMGDENIPVYKCKLRG